MKTESQVKTKEFLNPERLLKAIPVEPEMIVADFGCGNGHYAAAAGLLVGRKGQVHAYDVLEEGLSQTATLSRLSNLNNVSTRQCNLEKFGACELDEGRVDLVIMSGILHQAVDRDNVVREAYRVLKTGGRLLVVEWGQDVSLGPEVHHRIPEKQLRALLEKHGFRPVSASQGGPATALPAGSFHYALIYTK